MHSVEFSEHMRILVLNPPPQETLHGDQFDHGCILWCSPNKKVANLVRQHSAVPNTDYKNEIRTVPKRIADLLVQG